MAGEDITSEVLKYLKEEGPTNTFRLTRMMGLERNRLLTLIGKLEEKEAVKFERGNVIFLKFLPEGKAITKASSEPRKEATPIKLEPSSEKLKIKEFLQTENLRSENKQLQRKVSQLGEAMKELERKASAAPKTITKTVTRTIIKKVPVTKTIIKKVPVTKTVVRRIQAPLPVPPPPTENKVWEKLKAHSEQFKMSGSKLFENMKQLREPEFMK